MVMQEREKLIIFQQIEIKEKYNKYIIDSDRENYK